MTDQDSSKLTKIILNNFMVQRKPLARQGKVHVIKKLVRQAKKLREKKTKNEKQKQKFQRKAERLVEEVMVLKHLSPDIMMKFFVLNKKSFSLVGSNPKAKAEERALCRLAEHKGISAAINKFREQYPDWEEEVPNLIKGLGILHRQKKLKRMKTMGKLESYLEKEQQNLKLLLEVTNIDIDPEIIQRAAAASKAGEKKKTSSKTRKRKREMNLNSSSEKEGVERRKKEKKTAHLLTKTSKGKNEEIRDSGSDSGESMDDDKIEGVEINVGGKVERHIRTEGEEENDEEESESSLDRVSDDDPPDFVVSKLGQNLTECKGLTNDNSDSNEEHISEGESEHNNSDSENSESETQKVPERKAFVKTQYATKNKIHKVSRMAEVKQLDLTSVNGMVGGTEGQDASDSEDEDFFLGKANPKKVKKKKSSNFFLGSGKDDGKSESDDEESEEEDMESGDEGDRQGHMKRSHSDVESDDSGVIDTSKYFKKNIYRKDDNKRGTDRGRGVGRGRGGDQGHGRDRAQGWDRGRRGDRGRKWDREYGGNLGRGSSRGNKGWEKVREVNEESFSLSERQNVDLTSNEEDTREGGNSYKWDKDKENRKGGHGDGRGGRGDRRGGYGDRRGDYGDRRGSHRDRRGSHGNRRGGLDDRRGGPGDRRGGSAYRRGGPGDRRGGPGDRRGGPSDRRRGDRGSRFGGRAGGRPGSRPFSWQSDDSNPNMIPRGSKDGGLAAPVKGGASSAEHLQSLHPSWQAKLRQKEQLSSTTQFQGKRVVFNEDD